MGAFGPGNRPTTTHTPINTAVAALVARDLREAQSKAFDKQYGITAEDWKTEAWEKKFDAGQKD